MGRGVWLFLGALACAAAGLLAAAVVASPGLSQLPITTATTTTGTTATTTTVGTTTRAPQANLIADGVWVGKVEVGGLTPEGATALVKAGFGTPLRLVFGRRSVLVTPQRLGATARVKLAIDQARRAAPGTRLPLFVKLRSGGVTRYVNALGKRFDKPVRNAELVGLRGSRPWITKEQTGRRLQQRPAIRAIVAALRTHRRSVFRIRAMRVDPSVTRARFGPIVVIRRESKVLNLFRGMRLWKRLGVATGQSSYPTPIGRFRIVTMQRHPWWYPPDSDWAKDEKPIPPGPGNPLGTRWMGISAPGVGIHGTP
ncbi:MAG TPA: L,D-transpeptidase family protein, partial [Gaiellaceae bacterium]|nr:L,D-transpeptidase family protein [Gaiellaceae bacterium]